MKAKSCRFAKKKERHEEKESKGVNGRKEE